MINTTRMTGAKALVETLRLYNTEYLFFVCGTPQEIFAEIHDIMPEIKLILTRSEKAAAYMADAYARISGKPGVCFGQPGPGAVNLAAGILEPYMASIPVIAITGARATTDVRKNVYQEIDQLEVFKPVTKWNVRVCRTDRVAEEVRNAFRIATSGHPRPVHIDLHTDVVQTEADMAELYAEEQFAQYPSMRVAPDPDKIEKAADLMVKADRPVILAGGGAMVSQAWDEITELAELLSIPVATTLSGKGLIPENHPLAVGCVGAYTRKCANKVVSEADLVLFVGSATGGLTTNKWNVPKVGTKVIHIDIDPIEISRNYPTQVGIVADAKLALKELIDILKTMMKESSRKTSRIEKIQKIVKEWRSLVAPDLNSEEVPIKPQRIVKEVREVLGKDDIIVADTGLAAAWVGALYDVLTKGRTFIRASGSLGWSFPAAIGAKIAAPNKNVLCFIGDGGFGYHLSELETAARYKVPIVGVVNNNKALAFERHGFSYFLDDKGGDEATSFIDVNFGKVAETFGCYGVRVEKPGEIGEALRNAFDSGKPAVVDVVADPKEVGFSVVTYFERRF